MSTLLACGINHQTAPFALREQLVFSPENIAEPLQSLLEHTQIKEAAILSTCNRTEFYCINAEPIAIIDWLHQQRKLPIASIQPCIYTHYNDAAVRHLLRVASGLDSIMLGETQIAGQVKKAFFLAAAAGTLGNQLRRLANYVFSMSKQVRTETAIGMHPISFAAAAVNLAKRIFADLSQATVLFIGAGETIEPVAKYLQSEGVARFIVANRTFARGEALAKQLKGTAIRLADMGQYLSQADIVIAATASPVPIIGKGLVESALKIRKHRPMFMVDLSVPRDIEPEISQLDDVYVSTLEDLQAMVAQNIHNRHESAKQAEELIEMQVKHYMGTLRVLEAAPVISSYRKKAESVRNAELAKAMQCLHNGMSPEQVLNRLANNLTGKLLHTPSVQLRKAAYNKQEDVLEVAQWLLEI